MGGGEGGIIELFVVITIKEGAFEGIRFAEWKEANIHTQKTSLENEIKTFHYISETTTI